MMEALEQVCWEGSRLTVCMLPPGSDNMSWKWLSQVWLDAVYVCVCVCVCVCVERGEGGCSNGIKEQWGV